METPLSTYTFKSGETVKGVVFSIEGNSQLKESSFEECKFVFKDRFSLGINGCDFKKCTFESHASGSLYQQTGNLSIYNSKVFSDNILLGQFRDIQIVKTPILRLKDESKAMLFLLQDLQVVDSTIVGLCDQLSLDKVFLNSLNKKSSNLWNKKIIQSGACRNVVFDDVKLNPFYLATKCHDRSTLDLSRATLIDNWSMLRKKYSGINLFIVFLLTFIFILPILTHSFFLITLSKFEESFQSIHTMETSLLVAISTTVGIKHTDR